MKQRHTSLSYHRPSLIALSSDLLFTSIHRKPVISHFGIVQRRGVPLMLGSTVTVILGLQTTTHLVTNRRLMIWSSTESFTVPDWTVYAISVLLCPAFVNDRRIVSINLICRELPSRHFLEEHDIQLFIRSSTAFGQAKVSPDGSKARCSEPEKSSLAFQIGLGGINEVRLDNIRNDLRDVVDVP